MKYGKSKKERVAGSEVGRFPAAVLLAAVMFALWGCKGGPANPFFDPPGGTIDYLTSFSSFHMPGSFNAEYTWPTTWNSAEWEAVRMTLVDDYTWEKTVRIDYLEDQGGSEGQFKFAANAGWETGFGDSGVWGETTRGSDVNNILLSDRPDSVVIVTGSDYTFRFYETTETYEIVASVTPAGGIAGIAAFDNLPAPPYPAATATALQLPDSVSFGTALSDTADGEFLIENLPDGDYAVELTADGYMSEVAGGIQVAGETVDIGTITLSLLTGSITGPIDFDGVDAPPYPSADVAAYEASSWQKIGETTSDTSSGVYTLSGLPDDSYNIVAEAEGFVADTLFGITVGGGGEVDADTLFLDSAGWEWTHEAVDDDSDSRWGSGNELYYLKAGYDQTTLHLAFEFIVSTNGIILLIDNGDGLGVIDISGLDFFPRLLSFEDDFKARFIFAGWSGETFSLREITGETTTVEVTEGYSYTGDPSDGSPSLTELDIDWETLFPGSGGNPPPGTEIRIVLCLVGSDGSSAGDVCPDSEYPPGWDWNIPLTLTEFLEIPVDLD